MSDPIAEAINNAAKPQPIALQQIGPITMSTTGRPFVLGVPTNVTPLELADIATWLLTQVVAGIQAQAKQDASGPSIALPGGGSVPVKRPS